MKNRTIMLSLVTVFLTGVACKPAKKNDAARTEVSHREDASAVDMGCHFDFTIDKEMVPGCPSWGCGSNSPVVGALEYDLSNSEASHPYRIRRFKNGSGPPTIQHRTENGAYEAYDLRIDHGFFLADTRRIKEPGWWFQIEEVATEKTCVVNVSAYSEVEGWDSQEVVPAYTLTISPSGGRERALCATRQSWGRFKGAPSTKVDAALLVAEERYVPHEAKILPESDQNKYASWFNIACAGSALAKMRLMGFDPAQDRPNAFWKDRQAILKILTATYHADCVSSNSERKSHWTTAGVPLAISKCSTPQNCAKNFEPSVSGARTVEAYWDENGASCFSDSRLWSNGKQEGPKDKLRQECQAKARLGDCEQTIRNECKLAKCEEGFVKGWKTDAIAHPSH